VQLGNVALFINLAKTIAVVSDHPEYCGRCGAKLEYIAETNNCPQCGADIRTQTASTQVPSELEKQPEKSSLRKISIILGIIFGIYTFILIVSLFEYNMRLSGIRDMAFGLGNLVVARIEPSIEFGSVVGLLFFIETIILFLKPKQGKLIALIILGVVNILLTLWIINQIPQILYELFVMLSVGILLNISVLIYSGAGYRRIK
jgi:hypothetical protein